MEYSSNQNLTKFIEFFKKYHQNTKGQQGYCSLFLHKKNKILLSFLSSLSTLQEQGKQNTYFCSLHSPPQKSKCLYSNSPPPPSDLRRRYRAPGITRSQPLLSQRESQAQEPALTPRH